MLSFIRMGARKLLWVLPAALVAAGCSAAETFACSDDVECPSGRCELDGFCSFPKESCDSGWQYGKFSGASSGQCVPVDMGTDTGSMSESGLPTEPTLSTTGSDTTGSDSAEPTGGPQECIDGQVCLATVEGWSGPVTLAPLGACDGDVAFRGASAYDGPHACSCACEVNTPDSCDGVPVFLEFFANSGCRGMPQLSLELFPECDSLGSASPLFLRATSGTEASCDTQFEVIAEPIVGLDEQDGCFAPDGASCAGGVCADGNTLQCIYVEGDVPCPEGDFTQRTVVYQDYADNRSCSPCGCEGAYACEGEVEVVTNSQGCGAPGTALPIGACSDSPAPVYGAGLADTDELPTPICETSGGEIIGAVEGTAPITACCTG